MFKNQGNMNPEVVSHSELREILTDFKHSVVGSVKASMVDAMRQQRLEKTRTAPAPAPQTGSATYNPMADTDSEPEYLDSESGESDVEAWWVLVNKLK